MGGVIEGKFVGVQVLEKLSIKSTVIGENISQQIIPPVADPPSAERIKQMRKS